MTVFQLDAEVAVAQNLDDSTLELERFFFGDDPTLLCGPAAERAFYRSRRST